MARADNYQYEALLREPHEYIAAITYLFAAILLIIGSEYFLITPNVAYAGAAYFMYRCIVRYRQGRFIKRYQNNLIRVEPFIMKPSDLKADKKRLYIGRGFEWRKLHAQRLHDLDLEKNRRYIEPPKSDSYLRDISYEKQDKFLYKPLVWLNKKKQNTFVAEGKSYIHAVGMPEGEENVYQPLETRVGHTLVVGTTRVGKTVLCRQLVTQDIHRGETVIVFDPKGDAELLIAMYVEAQKAGRGDDFYIFHLGYPDISASYNPVGSFSRVTEVASRVANQMPDGGQSSAFKQFVWGYVNRITKALVALGQTPTYPKIKAAASDIEPLAQEYLSHILKDALGEEQMQIEVEKYQAYAALKAEDRRNVEGIDVEVPALLNGKSGLSKGLYLAAIANYDKNTKKIGNKVLTNIEEDTFTSINKALLTDAKYMDKLVASLQPFLEKMTTGAVSQLISPDFTDPGKQTFSWDEIISQNGIVYVGLDALSDSEVAAAVGNSMFADLTSVAGRIYKMGTEHGLPEELQTHEKKKICLHADEFNELAGSEFVPMLNKAGGANFQVTAYTQTVDDIESRVGSAAKAQQMVGNFNTLIMLRVLNEKTASLISNRFGKTTVSTFTKFSSSVQSSNPDTDADFTSSTQMREQIMMKELITPTELIQLPKGQGFALLGGNRLYKFRIPFVKWDKDKDLPGDITELTNSMKKQYQTYHNQYKKFDYVESFDIRETLNQGEAEDVFTGYVSQMQAIEEIEEW